MMRIDDDDDDNLNDDDDDEDCEANVNNAGNKGYKQTKEPIHSINVKVARCKMLHIFLKQLPW